MTHISLPRKCDKEHISCLDDSAWHHNPWGEICEECWLEEGRVRGREMGNCYHAFPVPDRTPLEPGDPFISDCITRLDRLRGNEIV